MSKTNFTKVEESLNEGIRKMEVRKLLKEADQAQAERNASANVPTSQSQNTAETTLNTQLTESRTHLLTSLQKDLKNLHKEHPPFYTKLGVKSKDLKKFLENPSSISPQDWEKLKKIKNEIDNYKKELTKNLPQSSDEDLVNVARTKSINKRFNVNDKWLPLH